MGESYLGLEHIKSNHSLKKVKRSLSKKKPARELKESCSSPKCRRSKLRNCDMFSETDRQAIFIQFWKDLDWDQKRVYVLSLTEKVPTKACQSEGDFSRRSESIFYYLQRNGKKLKVCQKMFLNTLGLRQSQVFRWIKGCKTTRKVRNTSKCIPEKDGTKYAKTFIDSLPKMESHYCRRDTTKLYLEPVYDSNAHLFRVYTEFCKRHKHPTVASRKFASIVKELNIGIFRPKKDKCDVCCRFEAGNLAVEEWRAHITKKDEARSAKDRDKQDSIDGICHALVLDVQAVKLSPMITASAMYYKTKLMVHNYSIFNLKTYNVRCYWWNETQGDLVASVFATALIQYLEEHFSDNLPVIIWSDGCTSQNRNKILSNGLLNLAQRSKKIIIQKYLEKGHTQMEVDSVHSVIERALKGKPIYHPMDYVEITRKARRKGPAYEALNMEHNMFLDYSRAGTMRYSDIRPGSKPGDPCVTDLRELRYNPSGIIEYKLDHSSEWQQLPKLCRTVDINSYPRLYKDPLPISKRKYEDLQELLPVIPEKYHEFYKKLPRKSK
ncbi:unnamed protein product [Orchesella dallaii]|uniref:Uncharacterized protein n=1 Tax=Orchesella dallaii TaxID=48710 RepID=A0ABP1Q9H9_9HEXA